MKKKIKTALISVSDKKNLKPLLNILKKNKIKIISSGGTYKEIKSLKFNCLEVSDFTNSPEILEGRVKTLHPNIYISFGVVQHNVCLSDQFSVPHLTVFRHVRYQAFSAVLWIFEN